MASGKEYPNFISDQLSGINGISHRAMMDEYIIYHNGKITGKNSKSADMFPDTDDIHLIATRHVETAISLTKVHGLGINRIQRYS